MSKKHTTLTKNYFMLDAWLFFFIVNLIMVVIYFGYPLYIDKDYRGYFTVSTVQELLEYAWAMFYVGFFAIGRMSGLFCPAGRPKIDRQPQE